MHLSAGWMPAGRQKKVAALIVAVGLALAALGSVAVSGPAANAGPVHMSPAEILGAGLLAGGCTGVLVGLAVWVHAAVMARWAVKQDDRHPVNHWRGPLTPGRLL
jgi:cation transporter-like permease